MADLQKTSQVVVEVATLNTGKQKTSQVVVEVAFSPPVIVDETYSVTGTDATSALDVQPYGTYSETYTDETDALGGGSTGSMFLIF
jgi:hypothetical protein